jgi:hypothetical protein
MRMLINFDGYFGSNSIDINGDTGPLRTGIVYSTEEAGQKDHYGEGARYLIENIVRLVGSNGYDLPIDEVASGELHARIEILNG